MGAVVIIAMACAAVREFIQMHETNQAFSLYLSVFEFSVHKPTELVTDVDDIVYAAGKKPWWWDFTYVSNIQKYFAWV